MLAKRFRISRKKEFDYIFKNGKSYRGRFMIVKVATNVNDFPRFAVVVSRKVSNRAVVRNMAKRKIRAAFARLMPRLANMVSIVVIVTRFSKDNASQIAADLEEVLVSARIIKKNV